MDINETVEEWVIAKGQLDQIKKKELSLRNELCSHILGDKLKGSKTEKFTMCSLTATAKLNTSIDNELLTTLWEDLTPADRECVVYKPSLIAKNYKTLDQKSMLHQTITTKPGMPQLKIKI